MIRLRPKNATCAVDPFPITERTTRTSASGLVTEFCIHHDSVSFYPFESVCCFCAI